MGLVDNPIIYLAKETWKFSKGNRKSVALYFLMFIIADSLILLEPLIVANLLNIIQEVGLNESTIFEVVKTLSYLVGIYIVFWIFHGPARVIEAKNAFLVRANYRKYLLDGVMSLPAKWHTDHHSGDTIDKVEKACDAMHEFAYWTFEVIDTIIKFVGSYIALVIFNLHSAYIVIFMVIITLTMIVKFDHRLQKRYKKLYKAQNDISAKTFDIISNITTVIILRIEKLVSNEIAKKVMSPFRLSVQTSKISEIKWALVSFCSSLMLFLVLLTYVLTNATAGAILAGTIYALYGYVQKINGLFFRFAYKYGVIVRQNAAVLNVQEISKLFKNKQKIRKVKLNNWNEIKVKDLNFSYHDSKTDLHLNDVNVSIKRKQRIALVGASGSGKTTFLKLMRELYDASNCKVYIDDKKLKHGFTNISDNITLIPQDPEIFTSTIEENITMGIPHTKKYIKKFTDMAQFSDVIKKLPNGLKSSIVEKGVNLSGGEKQRLALARGLMACEDKEIILLDEPTSSVDIKNESTIYKNVFSKYKNKTILSSIHKLHLLPLFDEVYLFSKGKIIAKGHYKELLKTSKQFKRMWDRQKTKH